MIVYDQYQRRYLEKLFRRLSFSPMIVQGKFIIGDSDIVLEAERPLVQDKFLVGGRYLVTLVFYPFKNQTEVAVYEITRERLIFLNRQIFLFEASEVKLHDIGKTVLCLDKHRYLLPELSELQEVKFTSPEGILTGKIGLITRPYLVVEVGHDIAIVTYHQDDQGVYYGDKLIKFFPRLCRVRLSGNLLLIDTHPTLAINLDTLIEKEYPLGYTFYDLRYCYSQTPGYLLESPGRSLTGVRSFEYYNNHHQLVNKITYPGIHCQVEPILNNLIVFQLDRPICLGREVGQYRIKTPYHEDLLISEIVDLPDLYLLIIKEITCYRSLQKDLEIDTLMSIVLTLNINTRDEDLSIIFS